MPHELLSSWKQFKPSPSLGFQLVPLTRKHLTAVVKITVLSAILFYLLPSAVTYGLRNKFPSASKKLSESENHDENIRKYIRFQFECSVIVISIVKIS